jgi:hypothetical protein
MKIELKKELKIKLLQSLRAGYIETSDYPEFENMNSLEEKNDEDLKYLIWELKMQRLDTKPQQLREEISILQELDKEMMAHNGSLIHIYTDKDKLLEYIRRIDALADVYYWNLPESERNVSK